MHLDHVGIATDDVESFAALYGDVLDVAVVHEEEFGEMNVVFLDAGGAYIEALEPLTDESAIARFLGRNGAGLHHLAFAVEDLEDVLSTVSDRGLQLIDETPRDGAWGHTVAFVHPDSTGGVLVEFVEH
ncbi:MAG: methylmalonyl-CoA epimerase [Halanaeroarchaeum sp.]